MFSYDDDGGEYDVETNGDRERWQEQRYEERQEEDREELSPEDYDEKYPDIPY